MGEKSTSKSRRATVPSLPVVAKSAAALPDGSALVSYCLLAALSLQYGAQPLMNARFLASRAVDPRAVVLATEGAKAALCLPSTALLGSRRRALPPGSRTHTRTRKLLSAAAPAVCYLVQNLALQRAYADLDSVTFNCLNQTKIVATAASLYLLTGVGQSSMQMVALVLVTLSGLLLQVTGERARAGTASVDTFRRGVAVRGVSARQARSDTDRAVGAGVRPGVSLVRPCLNAVTDGAPGACLLNCSLLDFTLTWHPWRNCSAMGKAPRSSHLTWCALLVVWHPSAHPERAHSTHTRAGLSDLPRAGCQPRMVSRGRDESNGTACEAPARFPGESL